MNEPDSSDPGWKLHAAAGLIVGLLFAGGLLREMSQHEWSFALSWHQWIEALAWPMFGMLGIWLGLAIIAIIKRARRGG